MMKAFTMDDSSHNNQVPARDPPPPLTDVPLLRARMQAYLDGGNDDEDDEDDEWDPIDVRTLCCLEFS